MSTGSSHPGLVMDFLRPARGVYPIAKTFHDGWVQGCDFEEWVHTWEQTLTPDERALWHYMQDQRDWDEHGDGADLKPFAIPVASDQPHVNFVVLGLGPDAQLKGSKGSVRFGAHPNVPASNVCANYLTLCQRFVDDFLSDPVHVAVIGPPTTGT